MDGPSIFNFTIQNIPKLLKQILIKNKLNEKKLIIIFYIKQIFSFKFNKKVVTNKPKKIIIDIENFGNTVSNTIL